MLTCIYLSLRMHVITELEDINNSTMAAHSKLLRANTAASYKSFIVNILDKCIMVFGSKNCRGVSHY